MDVSPKTHFLESIRRDRGSYIALLAEAIDNSFDAGASRIDIVVNRNKVSISDNGTGIAKHCQAAIVAFGDHREMSTTSLGRFGIGMKYQAVSAANYMSVRSISADGRMTLRVDWESLIKSGKWEVQDPNWTEDVTEPTGTMIVIRDLRWKAPNDKDIERATRELSQVFQPAIVSGKVITINKQPLPELEDPGLSSVVSGDIEIDGDIAASVRGGILTDPKSRLYQVHVGYRHRVILPRSSFGCGNAGGGLRRLFARVQLHGHWELSRFKDDISHDPRFDELNEKVEGILRPILDQCREASMDMVVREMEMRLNDRLPKEYRPAKPVKRHPQGRKGRKRNKHHGETKDGEENDQGPARKPSRSHGIKISFEDIGEDYGFGRFERSGRSTKTGRISLAKDNPHIAALLTNRDTDAATENIYQIAIGLYLNEKDNPPDASGQLGLDGDVVNSFGVKWWKLFSAQQRNGSKK